MCNMEHVPVCTSTYQYIPVYTEQRNDIHSIYQYVLVHTAVQVHFVTQIYVHELNFEYVMNVYPEELSRSTIKKELGKDDYETYLRLKELKNERGEVKARMPFELSIH